MASGDCELLKNLIIKITDFSKKYSNILDKDSAPLWNYAKENYNVTLDSILFNDILLWLGYLGLNDGEISEEELIQCIHTTRDVIKVKEKSQNSPKFKEIKEMQIMVPSWLTADAEKLEGKVVALPKREEIDTPIQEHLIVELYSK